MKTIERSITYTAIAGLIIVIIMLATCGPQGNADCTSITDTITITKTVVDSVPFEKPYVPVPKRTYTSKGKPTILNADTIGEFDWSPYLTVSENEEYVYFYYLDTILGQQVRVVIADTSMGLIVGRNVQITNLRPTDVTTKTTTPVKSKVKLFVGVIGGTDFKGGWQVAPTLGLQTKQDVVILGGVAFVNGKPSYQVGVLSKLKFKK